MKLQFEFIRDNESPNRFYNTNEIKIDIIGFSKESELYIKGSYKISIPHHAYAMFYLISRFFTNYEHGYHISKNFLGNNVGNQARAWLNRMIQDCPNYVNNF